MLSSLYLLQLWSCHMQRNALSLCFGTACHRMHTHTAHSQITYAWLQLVLDVMVVSNSLLCGPLAEALVHVAGMKFFPGYVNDARRQLLDAAAFRWHQTGQQQKKLMKWGDRSQLQGGMLMLEAPTPPATAQKGKQGRPQQELLSSGAPVPGSSTQTSGVAALVSGLCTACMTISVTIAV